MSLPSVKRDHYPLAFALFSSTCPQSLTFDGLAMRFNDDVHSEWSANYSVVGTGFPLPATANITPAKAIFQRCAPPGGAVTTCVVLTICINGHFQDKWQVCYKTKSGNPTQLATNVDNAASPTNYNTTTSATPTVAGPTQASHQQTSHTTTTKPQTGKSSGKISKLVKIIQALRALSCMAKHTSDDNQWRIIEETKQQYISEYLETQFSARSVDHHLTVHQLRHKATEYDVTNKIVRSKLRDKKLQEQLNRLETQAVADKQRQAVQQPLSPLKYVYTYVNPYRTLSCACTDTKFCLKHHKLLRCMNCQPEAPCHKHFQTSKYTTEYASQVD